MTDLVARHFGAVRAGLRERWFRRWTTPGGGGRDVAAALLDRRCAAVRADQVAGRRPRAGRRRGVLLGPGATLARREPPVRPGQRPGCGVDRPEAGDVLSSAVD